MASAWVRLRVAVGHGADRRPSRREAALSCRWKHLAYNDDARVRAASVEALGPSGLSDAEWKRLKAAASDSAEEVRVAAMRSMGYLYVQKRGDDAQALLRATAKDPKASPALRKAAEEGLRN